MPGTSASAPRWYAEVTRYQWLVLALASAGWVFDTFEGQVFNLTRGQMIPELLGPGVSPRVIKWWGDLFLAVFLAGGAIGGVAFGMLSDRLGRRPVMVLTILCYSVFSGLTYFATSTNQVVPLRFLVALGVGGEWAVAAALVAEVFPTRARAHASGIFHATSVLGTWLAALAGLAVGANWRMAYLVGVLPALLVLWVRRGIKEPERIRDVEATGRGSGSLRELFGTPIWARRAVVGVLFASVGMGTFWAVTVAGQDLTLELLRRHGVPADEAARRAKFAFGIVQTFGGGLGLLSFGPLAERLGRRPAFALMHVLGLLIVPVTCYVPQTYAQMLCILPFFGFFTLASHAGYAIYFPELFPTRLRATGAGFCFNGGRMLAVPLLFLSAELKSRPGVDLRLAVTMLSGLFLMGVVLLRFLPETRGEPLPESDPTGGIRR